MPHPNADQHPRQNTGQRSDNTSPALPKPRFSSVTAWVNDHFVPMYRRTLGGEFRWCARWWQHAEAISRLNALWYAWEALRLQGSTGIGIWYRDHLDHQLPILLGPRGPFYQCTETEHLEPHLAAVTPPPPGWRGDRTSLTSTLGPPAPLTEPASEPAAGPAIGPAGDGTYAGGEA